MHDNDKPIHEPRSYHNVSETEQPIECMPSPISKEVCKIRKLYYYLYITKEERRNLGSTYSSNKTSSPTI